ncbi:MAG: hypothetical protein LBN38_02880 [Verrucomicrobiota bacterium]|jgi:hypothetical protein|nr:hypothetical protein [Verrucomicrobiota bacterium]
MALRLGKFLLGAVLVPLCIALTMTLWRLLLILAQSPARLPMLHVFSCVAGIVIWALIWLFLPPLTRTYILGHELTHALWTMLFGGRPSGLKVTEAGGSVRVSKNNAWVTLAPYFFPLYTFAVALIWLGLTWAFPAVRPYGPVFLFWIGLSWSFHITFTLRFLTYNQPDIREHGRLFSYTLIYALNLLCIGLALLAVSSWTGREAAADFWLNLHLLGQGVHLFYEWLLTRLPTRF